MIKQQGVRKYPSEDGYLWLAPGEYGKNPHSGCWEARTPSGLTGNLSGHEVTEHEDGTITVKPSILIMEGNEARWHGYLERGVWREV